MQVTRYSPAANTLTVYIMSGLRGISQTAVSISLLTRLSVLECSRQDIEEFVHSINDYDLKLIIQYRFLRGKHPMSWQAIAMKLGYCAEHTPKRKLQKYFSNVGNVGF